MKTKSNIGNCCKAVEIERDTYSRWRGATDGAVSSSESGVDGCGELSVLSIVSSCCSMLSRFGAMSTAVSTQSSRSPSCEFNTPHLPIIIHRCLISFVGGDNFVVATVFQWWRGLLASVQSCVPYRTANTTAFGKWVTWCISFSNGKGCRNTYCVSSATLNHAASLTHQMWQPVMTTYTSCDKTRSKPKPRSCKILAVRENSRRKYWQFHSC